MHNFCDGKLTKVKAGQGAGTSAVESDVIDMQGYDRCVFFGTIATSNAGNYMNIQSGTDATVTDAADLAGTKVTAAYAASVVWCEIVRPAERYLRAVITRGSSTATGDLYCYQYGATAKQVSNLTTNVIIGEVHIDPTEGTA